MRSSLTKWLAIPSGSATFALMLLTVLLLPFGAVADATVDTGAGDEGTAGS